MKTLVPMIVLMVTVFTVAPAMGSDIVPIDRMVYEEAIDDAIARSHQKASLMASRSAKLRMKGHREASKAMFLETHRERLLNDMLEVNLEPRGYKVERFLNERFSCTCYATWAAK